MFFSDKFKYIKPEKDYNLKNNSLSLFNDKINKYKNNLEKLKNKKSLPIIIKRIGGSKSVPKNIKQKKIENKKKQEIKQKESQVTSYLDRKKINDLPIIYPLFLSYNNSYDTLSEKNRVEKILNKFICLKTQIIKDYKNRDKILKEFMIKNGINDKKNFTEKKLSNFNEYLKKPFKFDPKKTIIDIINEALNYEYIDIHKDENPLKPVNIFNNHNVIYRNKHIKKNINSNSFDNINSDRFYKNLICLNFNGIKYDETNLPKLINELEENIKQIQFEGAERINMLRGGNKKLKTFKIKDNNKFVPNLCLTNQDFKEQYEYIINKENKKLMENYSRYQHIKNINDRMYYNNIKKRFTEQNFTDEIKRKLKLTEYIIVQRAKKKMFLSQFKKLTDNLLEDLSSKVNA